MLRLDDVTLLKPFDKNLIRCTVAVQQMVMVMVYFLL